MPHFLQANSAPWEPISKTRSHPFQGLSSGGPGDGLKGAGPGTAPQETGCCFAPFLCSFLILLSAQSRQSCLFVALWTVAHQAPLSMGFSRQEDWSGVPCPPPGDLPKAGIEPPPLTSPALAGSFFTTSTTWEAHGVLTLNAKYLLFYSWPQFILIIYNLKPIIIAIL